MEIVVGIVAVLGFVTGSLSLYLRWRDSRTRIELRVNPATAPMHSGGTDAYGNTIEEPTEAVLMEIINKSSHPVKITQVGGSFGLSRKRSFVTLRPYPLQRSLPFQLGPRDNCTIWFARPTKDDSTLLRFQVITADGKRFRTRPLTLARRPHMEFV